MKPYTQDVQATALPIPSTLDDIVFENRNKAYGAYELRTHYTTNINRALMIGVSCFLLMLLTNFLFARQKDENLDKDGVVINVQKLPDEELPIIEKPKEPEPPKPVEQLKTIKFLIPEVVEETNNEMPPPTPEELENAVISNKTQDGIETNEIAAEPPTEAPTAVTKVLEIEEDNTAFITVEVQPSFMGGNSEMYKFLGKNLKYPSAAQRANIQGKVFLSFIVEKDGSITDIETMKGIGFGCDEEAMRVVKLMPKWIAGKQNGRNVRVKFTIPVFFRLDN
jgi:periplasmic protein TonB